MALQIQTDHPAMPDYVWGWRVRCPQCDKKTLIHMTEPQLQERRVFIISDTDGWAFSGPLTCQVCESPSLIRLEINHDGIVVACLTQIEDIDDPTTTSIPEKIQVRSNN